MLEHWIERLTVRSADDGHRFTKTERLDRIAAALADSAYRLHGERRLARIYAHRDFDARRPSVLVSTHVDAVYREHFVHRAAPELYGTFDNSVTNAVALALMLEGRLPAQALVAFTGDEEDDSRGARQVMKHVAADADLARELGLVVVLDVTEEAYGVEPLTVENFLAAGGEQYARLGIASAAELLEFIARALPAVHLVEDAEPDESWEYDEHGVPVVSLCLPCRVLGDDMPDDTGVAVLRADLPRYADGIVALAGAACACPGQSAP